LLLPKTIEPGLAEEFLPRPRVEDLNFCIVMLEEDMLLELEEGISGSLTDAT
jgi:hypothetical protein